MLASFPPFMICNINRGIYYLFHLFLYSAPNSKWWLNDFPGKKSCLSPRILKEKYIYFNDFKVTPVWLCGGLMWGFLEDNHCIHEAFLKSAFHNLWHALLTLCQSLWNTIKKSLNHSFNICGLAATTAFCICPAEDRQDNDSHFVAHSNFAFGPAQLFEDCRDKKVLPVQKLHPLSPVPVGTASALGQGWIATKSVPGKRWAELWWVEPPKSPNLFVCLGLQYRMW